jgi:hypothetical protein
MDIKTGESIFCRRHFMVVRLSSRKIKQHGQTAFSSWYGVGLQFVDLRKLIVMQLTAFICTLKLKHVLVIQLNWWGNNVINGVAAAAARFQTCLKALSHCVRLHARTSTQPNPTHNTHWLHGYIHTTHVYTTVRTSTCVDARTIRAQTSAVRKRLYRLLEL